MKIKVSFYFGLVGWLAACGGSEKSGLEFGAPDAVSRKNAVNSTSVSSKSAGSSSNSSSVTSYLASTLSQQPFLVANSSANGWDVTGNGSAGHGTKTCKIHGSAGLTYFFNANGNVLLIKLNSNECIDEDQGGFSGVLDLEIPIDFTKIKTNGSVRAFGKNADGKLAEHSLTLSDLVLPMDFDPQSNRLNQLNCSGSITVDGIQKDCKAAFIE